MGLKDKMCTLTLLRGKMQRIIDNDEYNILLKIYLDLKYFQTLVEQGLYSPSLRLIFYIQVKNKNWSRPFVNIASGVKLNLTFI